MAAGKKFVLVKHSVGNPKPEDFSLVEVNLQPLKDGGKINNNILIKKY